ncbi:PepSY domain-containing protein [uncultured Methanomethylovorans sp.]|uniref:PepSY domain-containing protein n=1 Tax=uncultured Methanomethylovorans sp. TaxID=183759 RepID=UPI002AA6151E|nr:PepSY domain-containing protein [uncultured Methanomethylovorans sp.]
MRNRTITILAIVLLTGLAATTLVSAETNFLQHASGYVGGFCNWGTGGNGYGTGYCAAYANQEPTVKTVEEALTIAQDKISVNVTENDIYQMGRWWIVSYTVDGTAKQGRIDTYTGEVIPDFFASQYATSGQYRQGMGRGYGMMGSGRY